MRFQLSFLEPESTQHPRSTSATISLINKLIFSSVQTARSAMMTTFIICTPMSRFVYFAAEDSETFPKEIPEKVGYSFQWILEISTVSFHIERSAGLVNPVDSKKPVKPGVCGGNPVNEKATKRILTSLPRLATRSRLFQR